MRWRRGRAGLVLLLAGCASGSQADPTPADAAVDALVDAAVACEGDATLDCTANGCEGTARCGPAGWSACVGPPEICNARDDDCDGRIDEGFDLGAPCRIGVGACAVDGLMACTDAGESACSGTPRRPGPERCDGIDGDCDGTVDEGEAGGALTEACYPGPPETRDVGVCSAGLIRCSNGAWSACVGSRLPAAETCDGVDEDCDGRIDEDPDGAPLTQRCFDGPPGAADVGACVSGRQVCAAGVWGACEGATLPAPELCDGVDDDCDGHVDETADEGPLCTVGQGPCARTGRIACVDGVQACDVAPGRPEPEVCDAVDNDCDGIIDPAPVCALFASCRVARDAGEVRDGVYRLRPGPDLSEFAVYCDQSTDGGGWSLVASSRDLPVDDRADPWHPDLRRLDPQAGHAGLWAGLRHLDVRFDVRLACRPPDAADDAFAVDTVHYATDWYPRWTAGDDAASCFHLPDGTGADAVPFARRDLRSGRWLRRGSPWANGGLVAEAACDTDDFAFDFEDGGLAGVDPADGTDWGSVAGTARCGGPVVGGEWFVFVREASRWRPDERFAVGSGPHWDGAPAWSCRAACRARAGLDSPLAGFACGVAADHLDRLAHLDGWGEESRFCGEETAPDSFVLPSDGQPYDCGAEACSFSAWVDDHGCAEENQCWRAAAPPAFVPPAAGSTGTLGAESPWRICAADAGQADVAAGAGISDAAAICEALGYGVVAAHGADCPADCGPCAWADGPAPAPVEGGRWRCAH